MAKVTITPKRLGSALQRLGVSAGKRVRAGMIKGAFRGERAVVRKTPADRGELRRSWRVKPGSGMTAATLVNDAPHAGIVELGARPHGISPEGRESIGGWVRRHFPGASRREISRITWGIIRKIRRVGQAPTFFVRDTLPELRDLTRGGVESQLAALARRPPK